MTTTQDKDEILDMSLMEFLVSAFASIMFQMPSITSPRGSSVNKGQDTSNQQLHFCNFIKTARTREQVPKRAIPRTVTETAINAVSTKLDAAHPEIKMPDDNPSPILIAAFLHEDLFLPTEDDRYDRHGHRNLPSRFYQYPVQYSQEYEEEVNLDEGGCRLCHVSAIIFLGKRPDDEDVSQDRARDGQRIHERKARTVALKMEASSLALELQGNGSSQALAD
ncbi:hypothetical protein MKZ38_010143 [Zalerion maritima]|uniref:Uncharacterized protein n=1 Tax=Zalerion maritima TaxID=339359 RepID=A0AAD5RGD2_9PEZI|nr:hypothetical protein MKZ38_010143 [Zalerion maritima]